MSLHNAKLVAVASNYSLHMVELEESDQPAELLDAIAVFEIPTKGEKISKKMSHYCVLLLNKITVTGYLLEYSKSGVVKMAAGKLVKTLSSNAASLNNKYPLRNESFFRCSFTVHQMDEFVTRYAAMSPYHIVMHNSHIFQRSLVASAVTGKLVYNVRKSASMFNQLVESHNWVDLGGDVKSNREKVLKQATFQTKLNDVVKDKTVAYAAVGTNVTTMMKEGLHTPAMPKEMDVKAFLRQRQALTSERNQRLERCLVESLTELSSLVQSSLEASRAATPAVEETIGPSEEEVEEKEKEEAPVAVGAGASADDVPESTVLVDSQENVVMPQVEVPAEIESKPAVVADVQSTPRKVLFASLSPPPTPFTIDAVAVVAAVVPTPTKKRHSPYKSSSSSSPVKKNSPLRRSYTGAVLGLNKAKMNRLLIDRAAAVLTAKSPAKVPLKSASEEESPKAKKVVVAARLSPSATTTAAAEEEEGKGGLNAYETRLKELMKKRKIDESSDSGAGEGGKEGTRLTDKENVKNRRITTGGGVIGNIIMM